MTDLIAGQSIYVGTLTVWEVEGNVVVVYEITNQDECEWGMIESQLYVGLWPIDENGEGKDNFPAPGRFPYKHENLNYSTYDRYIVPVPVDENGLSGTYYVAAHTTVCCDDRVIQAEGGGYCEDWIDAVDFIAGQNYNCGKIEVSIEGDDLVVDFLTTGGWQMTETHLYVGEGKPEKHSPGQFPYKHEDLGGVTWDQYIVPLADVISDFNWGAETEVCFAAHAVVERWDEDGEYQEETAWGDGEKIKQKGPWAMYFCSDIPWCDDQGEISCETAWAFGDYDFQEYFPDNPNGKGQWGWWFYYPR